MIVFCERTGGFPVIEVEGGERAIDMPEGKCGRLCAWNNSLSGDKRVSLIKVGINSNWWVGKCGLGTSRVTDVYNAE